MAFPRLFIDRAQSNYYDGSIPNTFGDTTDNSYRLVNVTVENSDDYISLFTGKSYKQTEFFNVEGANVARLIVKTGYDSISDLPANFFVSILNHNFDDTIPVKIMVWLGNILDPSQYNKYRLYVSDVQLDCTLSDARSVTPDANTKNTVCSFYTADSSYYEYLIIDIFSDSNGPDWNIGDNIKIGGIGFGEYYEFPHSSDIASKAFRIENKAKVSNEDGFYEFRNLTFDTPDHTPYNGRRGYSLTFSHFNGTQTDTLLGHLDSQRGMFHSFVYQDNSNDNTDFGLFRLTSNSVERSDIAPNLHRVSLSMIETW